MAAAPTYFKLGLFVIAGLLAMIATAFGLGLHRIRADKETYHTYFDESVQGLEIGSPVRYRGVAIGTVADISVAPDLKHVDVTLSVIRQEGERLGLSRHPNLRAQLASQGITGVKLVNIDFVDPRLHPSPVLGFPPDDNYIPAMPSLIKSLEESLTSVLQKMPELMEVTVSAVERVEVILEDFHGQRVPQRLGTVLDGVDAALTDLRGLANQIDRARIPDKTAKAIDDLDEAIVKVNRVLDHLGGEGGLVATTSRAAAAIGELGRGSAGSAQDLEQTLRHLDEAVQAIRDLARSIERDPDSLVKGRARERVR